MKFKQNLQQQIVKMQTQTRQIQQLQQQVTRLQTHIEQLQSSQQQVQSDTSTPQPSDEKANWKTYQNKELGFEFKYPSRLPYCAENGATKDNFNKTVTLKVRYDNGWEDMKFSETTIEVEATPFELESEITYTCNISNYKH